MGDEDNRNIDLLREIKQGNRNAFNQYYRLNVGLVRAFLRRKGLMLDSVEEDIIQEIFFKVWQKASYYQEDRGRPVNWLLAIAQNRLYDYWRRVQKAPIHEEISELDKSEKPAATESEITAEVWLSVQKALKILSSEEMKLFKMVYVDGFTMKECSAALDTPSGTIKWRIANIVKRLKVEVEA